MRSMRMIFSKEVQTVVRFSLDQFSNSLKEENVVIRTSLLEGLIVGLPPVATKTQDGDISSSCPNFSHQGIG